jgi:NhaA family Na+:H+ antiporter
VLGVVADVGFTMALFIAQLAFADSQLLAAAKLAVLAVSGAAALIGLILGRFALPEPRGGHIAQSADAESSTEL